MSGINKIDCPVLLIPPFLTFFEKNLAMNGNLCYNDAVTAMPQQTDGVCAVLHEFVSTAKESTMKQNQKPDSGLICRCGALALAAILSCGAFVSCGTKNEPAQGTGTSAQSTEATVDSHQKTFTDAGLTVTLSDSFKKSAVQGYTVCYEASDPMQLLLGLKENSSTLNGYTLDQYAKQVISNNAALQGKTVKHDNGLTYFEFESTVDGVTYGYFAAVYQNGNDYWLLQFSSTKANYSRLRPDFVIYAKSVSFS